MTRDDPAQAWWRVVRVVSMVSDRWGNTTQKVRVMLDNGTVVEFFANTWEEAIEQMNRYRPVSPVAQKTEDAP